jgi:hypothetical protein
MNKEFSRRRFMQLVFARGADKTLGLSRREIASKFQTEAFRNYIYDLIADPPDIGGVEKYHVPLEAGMGFVTWHRRTIGCAVYQGEKIRDKMSDFGWTYADLTPQQKNIYDLTVNGRKSVKNRLKHQRVTPIEALQSGFYAGYLAVRSPNDIGRKYLAWAVDQSGLNQEIRFIGAVLPVDCPKQLHWNNNFSQLEYMKTGIQWIGEVNDELMRQLPLGANPDPNNLNRGRPGLVLVSEQEFYRQRFPSSVPQE